ncbi:aspartic peptidase domain-containing protein [Mycena vitilis]|nr:aspartic peptidase domain-containing protein [Mycena vitilis]
MFCSIFSGLFASVLTVCAKPLPLPPAGINIPIARSNRHRPPTFDSSSLPVCNFQSIERERQGLLNKYRDVYKNLNKIEPASPFLDIIATAEAEAEAPFIPPPALEHTMSMKDYNAEAMDLMYYGQMSVGTPPQILTMDIDTGSADLWMPVRCPECTNRQFEDTKSSTFKNSGEDFSVFYGSGEVYGTLMQETVSIGGLAVHDLYFGGVSQVSDDFNELPNDGLLGLAFGTIAQSGKPTFFETLIANNMLPAPMFSVHLSRNHENGSEVCFGGIDYSKTLGLVDWVAVSKQTYWSVLMDAVSVNQEKLPTQINGIIDTGTTLIYVPDAMCFEIYKMIPGSKPAAAQFGSGTVFSEPKFYTYPCSTKLAIAFSFNGRSFSIDMRDFNLGLSAEDSTDCVGGILPLRDFPSNIAIIGDEFLKSWYTTFDYSDGGKVGFSPSINNEK